MQKVKKAVIPAAGFGTRFLPITKGVCKEMLPIVDKPALYYIVEEIVNAGITDILIITNKLKTNIPVFFGETKELDDLLIKDKKDDFLKISRDLQNMANITYVNQEDPKGLADAVYRAKDFTNGEPFALLLGDDLIYTEEGKTTGVGQLKEIFEKTGKSVIGSMQVSDDDVNKYGNIGYKIENGYNMVYDLLEKPKAKDKLSSDAIIGRYVLDNDIFEIIENTPINGKEVCFTDSLLTLANKKGLISYNFKGIRYDTGDKLGFLQATTEYALRDKKLGKDYKEYLIQLLGK